MRVAVGDFLTSVEPAGLTEHLYDTAAYCVVTRSSGNSMHAVTTMYGRDRLYSGCLLITSTTFCETASLRLGHWPRVHWPRSRVRQSMRIVCRFSDYENICMLRASTGYLRACIFIHNSLSLFLFILLFLPPGVPRRVRVICTPACLRFRHYFMSCVYVNVQVSVEKRQVYRSHRWSDGVAWSLRCSIYAHRSRERRDSRAQWTGGSVGWWARQSIKNAKYSVCVERFLHFLYTRQTISAMGVIITNMTVSIF